jgi:hypothetical protein
MARKRAGKLLFNLSKTSQNRQWIKKCPKHYRVAAWRQKLAVAEA